ncbi:Gfo/Idh/MocA family protein [Saccharomonospora saliphila]|uniref:Gfo/Idh/MocA family protein n=1 Tax=Saccharomonospora saliphila TaxID=369829 RepID=UPI0003601072|nr:Gfo/Idh/MocA family oxidoreductase [Saccharomonospora saliphila]
MTGENPIRLGLLGCADIAPRRILPAVSATPGIDLVAVASRGLAKARTVAERHGATAVEGYERLLERDDVDAVYLPLPPGLHAPWVRRALMAGKHVLAEKPLTTSLADTLELTALARATGRVLRENFMFVHHCQHEHVRRLLADGAVGRPRLFSAAFAIPRRPPGDIRYDPELGGGALVDVGGYPLRAAQLVLGPGFRVTGAALRHESALGVDTGGTALISYGDGVLGQLSFGLDHRYTSRYSILGDTGRLTLEHVFTTPAGHRPVVRIDRQDHQEELVLPADDQCANAIAAFAHAVRHGPAHDDTIRVQAEAVDRLRRHATAQDDDTHKDTTARPNGAPNG